MQQFVSFSLTHVSRAAKCHLAPGLRTTRPLAYEYPVLSCHKGRTDNIFTVTPHRTQTAPGADTWHHCTPGIKEPDSPKLCLRMNQIPSGGALSVPKTVGMDTWQGVPMNTWQCMVLTCHRIPLAPALERVGPGHTLIQLRRRQGGATPQRCKQLACCHVSSHPIRSIAFSGASLTTNQNTDSRRKLSSGSGRFGAIPHAAAREYRLQGHTVELENEHKLSGTKLSGSNFSENKVSCILVEMEDEALTGPVEVRNGINGSHVSLQDIHEEDASHVSLQDIHEEVASHVSLQDIHEEDASHVSIQDTHGEDGSEAVEGSRPNVSNDLNAFGHLDDDDDVAPEGVWPGLAEWRTGGVRIDTVWGENGPSPPYSLNFPEMPSSPYAMNFPEGPPSPYATDVREGNVRDAIYAAPGSIGLASISIPGMDGFESISWPAGRHPGNLERLLKEFVLETSIEGTVSESTILESMESTVLKSTVVESTGVESTVPDSTVPANASQRKAHSESLHSALGHDHIMQLNRGSLPPGDPDPTDNDAGQHTHPPAKPAHNDVTSPKHEAMENHEVAELASKEGLTLTGLGKIVLGTPCVHTKLAVTHLAFWLWERGSLAVGHLDDGDSLDVPALPEKPTLVHPWEVPKPGKKSKLPLSAHLIHTLAHVELNAVHLAWDTAVRFAPLLPQLGRSFFGDFLRVADDEARHFGWCQQRLQELGFSYGDMPAHNLLWVDCHKSSQKVEHRLAVIPMVQEARGLDAGPRLVERLVGAADSRSAAIVKRICEEEMAHVAVGVAWFSFVCKQLQAEPYSAFSEITTSLKADGVKGPFNHEARALAGLPQHWYDRDATASGATTAAATSAGAASAGATSACVTRDKITSDRLLGPSLEASANPTLVRTGGEQCDEDLRAKARLVFNGRKMLQVKERLALVVALEESSEKTVL